ncbi:MAG: DUF309 domain-containing protein [Chloroflexota bacterium]|nr:DUF309 domain-containing protein [Chloroflexota bacterium]PLS78324.1 MAG: hypothetical protein CYG59_19180 [Chloroflexota bacterium]
MAYSHHYLAFVEHFNRGEYRACVEPLEELWFAQRDDFHKALIRLVVGLNQLKLGLHSGPRFLFATARELLEPYGAYHQGLDLRTLNAFIAEQEGKIGSQAGSAEPRFVLELNPPAATQALMGVASAAEEA